MAGKYHPQAVKAYNTLKRKGGKGTLTVITDVHDPVAQTKTSTGVSYTFYAVAETATRKQSVGAKLFGATALVDRKLELLNVAAYKLPGLPETGTAVAWAGLAWKVIYATPIDPAGDEPVMYLMMIER